MANCQKCNDTGIHETGNNDLPCDCPAGAAALFNVAGVDGQVTGEEIRKHFFNDSPNPIIRGRKNILASSLPGRKILSFSLKLHGLRVKARPGVHIKALAPVLTELATSNDLPVFINFGNVELVVEPGMTNQKVLDQFFESDAYKN